jgi:hypothetical protein
LILKIGTAGSGGTYYYVGSAVSNVVNKYVPEVKMNPEATAARRWIILNLPTRQSGEDDGVWLKRTIDALNKCPRGWKGERPPGKDSLKEVGIRGPILDAVGQLALLAMKAGVDGVVASPRKSVSFVSSAVRNF